MHNNPAFRITSVHEVASKTQSRKCAQARLSLVSETTRDTHTFKSSKIEKRRVRDMGGTISLVLYSKTSGYG